MSIVRANRWQRTDGTSVGAVIQVQSTVYTTTTSQSISARTDTNITGLTASITPYTISSRILVMGRWYGEYTGTAPWDSLFYFARNGTKFNAQTSTSNRSSGLATYATNYQNGGSWDQSSTAETLSIFTIDSPASISSLTYTMGFCADYAGTLYTNRTITDTDSYNFERGSSEIILMEIAG